MLRLALLCCLLIPIVGHTARLFNDAASDNIEASNATVSTFPLSYAGWARSNDNTLSASQVIVSISDTNSATRFLNLSLGGTGVSNFASAAINNGQALSTTAWTVNTWVHVCGIHTSSSNRTVYLNGGSVGTNTDNGTNPTALDITVVGRLRHTSATAHMSGDIAEVGIWNVGLTAEECVSLARGVSPVQVRPHALITYLRLIRDVSDLLSTTVFTPTGTTVSPHPRMHRRLLE
jgi:Concanavalin A-like lectin/glucanases superfamily